MKSIPEKHWFHAKNAQPGKGNPQHNKGKRNVYGRKSAPHDDEFCFTFDGLVFQNKNNNASVHPWDGYKLQTSDPGLNEFSSSAVLIISI